jgi:hypothetical protein
MIYHLIYITMKIGVLRLLLVKKYSLRPLLFIPGDEIERGMAASPVL